MIRLFSKLLKSVEAEKYKGGNRVIKENRTVYCSISLKSHIAAGVEKKFLFILKLNCIKAVITTTITIALLLYTLLRCFPCS